MRGRVTGSVADDGVELVPRGARVWLRRHAHGQRQLPHAVPHTGIRAGSNFRPGPRRCEYALMGAGGTGIAVSRALRLDHQAPLNRASTVKLENRTRMPLRASDDSDGGRNWPKVCLWWVQPQWDPPSPPSLACQSALSRASACPLGARWPCAEAAKGPRRPCGIGSRVSVQVFEGITHWHVTQPGFNLKLPPAGTSRSRAFARKHAGEGHRAASSESPRPSPLRPLTRTRPQAAALTHRGGLGGKARPA
jgi:hypothetical protein